MKLKEITEFYLKAEKKKTNIFDVKILKFIFL